MRNRDLALDAAMALLAEPGTPLTVETIARRAGLGAGTVVRAFGGKDALLDAAVARLLGPVVQRARDLIADTTPYQALRTFLRELIAFQRAHHAINEQLTGLDLPATTALRTDLVGAFEQMIEGAQHDGQIRTDLDLAATAALITATAPAVARADPDLTDTYLTVLLDGLTAPRPRDATGSSHPTDPAGRGSSSAG